MKKSGGLVILSPIEPGKIQMYSPTFYAAFTTGGFYSCFLPYTAATYLSHVKPTPIGFVITRCPFEFGFYEFLKKQYSYYMGPEHANKHKTLFYLASSASAAMTSGGLPVGLLLVFRIIRSPPTRDNIRGSITFSQIPDAMIKFASFETVVGMIYKHAIPIPKDRCSKPLQLGVSFVSCEDANYEEAKFMELVDSWAQAPWASSSYGLLRDLCWG